MYVICVYVIYSYCDVTPSGCVCLFLFVHVGMYACVHGWCWPIHHMTLAVSCYDVYMYACMLSPRANSSCARILTSTHSAYPCVKRLQQTHLYPRPCAQNVKLIAFELAGEDRDRRENPVLSRLKIAFFALHKRGWTGFSLRLENFAANSNAISFIRLVCPCGWSRFRSSCAKSQTTKTKIGNLNHWKNHRFSFYIIR